MELAKYNIDIAALCETRLSEPGSLNDLEYSFFWSGKPERERQEAGVEYRHKADRNATASKWQNHDDETTSEQGQICYNYQRVRSKKDKPRWKKEAFYNQLAIVLSGTIMLQALHTRMMANVSVGGEVSEPFRVTNVVKQGCVLAPTHFSIFLSAMLDEAFRGDGV